MSGVDILDRLVAAALLVAAGATLGIVLGCAVVSVFDHWAVKNLWWWEPYARPIWRAVYLAWWNRLRRWL